jgi:hypothetical protein
MKSLRIVWILLLVGVGFYGVLWIIGPMLFIHVRSLVTDPRAIDGDLLTILEALVCLATFLAFLAALSPLINHRLMHGSRLFAGALALYLLVGWLGAFVVSHYGRASLRERLLPGMPLSVSLWGELAGFGAPEFLVIAVVSFWIAAVTGKGPLLHAGDFLRSRSAGKKKPE